MKKIIFTISMLFIILSTSLSLAQDFIGNINVIPYSVLTLDSKWNQGQWGKLSKQTGSGIEIDVRSESDPISLTIGIFRYTGSKTNEYPIFGTNYSYSEGLDLDTTIVDFGIKKIWHQSDNPNYKYGLTFSVGGGLEYANTKVDYIIENELFGKFRESNHNEGVGYWMKNSIYYTFMSGFNVGGEVKYSYVDVDFIEVNNAKFNVGGFSYGIVVGYNF